MSELFILTGASRGMGRAMAQQLLQRGEVTLLALSRGVDPALEDVAADAGSLLLQWQVDLSDPLPAAQRVNDWLGSLHAQAFQSATLINNAGTVGRPAPLAQADLADLAQALRVGLEAPMLLTS
ncbi:MAG: SDR family NAD(P)-dependent oxidoreductase, partial [Comamonadaceae bacterium]